MEHKYVPLAEISNDTLKEFNLGNTNQSFNIPMLPEFKLPVMIHENLKRIATDEDLQKSILIALCEVIVGNYILYRAMPNDRPQLNIPDDFGYSGEFDADFSDPKTVRIINLLGVNKIRQT